MEVLLGRIVFVVLLKLVVESAGATIDIHLNIDMGQRRARNDYNQNDPRPRTKSRVTRHFFDSDYIMDEAASSVRGVKTTPPIHQEEQGADQDPNYPYEQIDNFLKANPHFRKFFPPAVPDLGTRGGGDEDDGESLCQSRKDSYYSPQMLKNTRGIMKTIVNDDKNRQFVERERCVTDGNAKCSSYKILGYTSMCVQQYRKVRLWTFSNNLTDDLPIDDFRIPSCCVCKLKPDTTV